MHRRSDVVSSIYSRSKTSVYRKALHSVEFKRSVAIEDGHFTYYLSPKTEVKEQKFRKITEIGPSKDSPRSFYFYKRRDQSRERKLEEDKLVSPIESPIRRRTATPRTRRRLDRHEVLVEKPQLGLSKGKLRRPVSKSERYNHKLERIISACEAVQPSSFTQRVTAEQMYIGKINRQLQLTATLISRFQDSEAGELQSMFDKFEADEVDFLSQTLEAKHYFHHFSNSPSKQLELVVRMLKRKKNELL
jgi:hypothetical protein